MTFSKKAQMLYTDSLAGIIKAKLEYIYIFYTYGAFRLDVITKFELIRLKI